jgi:hypothetical protein
MPKLRYNWETLLKPGGELHIPRDPHEPYPWATGLRIHAAARNKGILVNVKRYGANKFRVIARGTILHQKQNGYREVA